MVCSEIGCGHWSHSVGGTRFVARVSSMKGHGS